MWCRYLEDIICLWIGADRQVDNFVNTLNNFNQNNKFAIEKGYNSSVNFLDISDLLENNNFIYNIYRNTTHIDTIILSSSNYPINIKLAAFNGMMHRLINVPVSKSTYMIKLNTIYKIALNNEYV